jgi:hypothetical protein
LAFFVVNLLFGLFLFDIPKSIFAYGINESLSFFDFFIYSLAIGKMSKPTLS